jgi:hypothetical protein
MERKWDACFSETGLEEAYMLFIELYCPKLEVLCFTGDMSRMVDLHWLNILMDPSPEAKTNAGYPVASLGLRDGCGYVSEIQMYHTPDLDDPASFNIGDVSLALHDRGPLILHVGCLEPLRDRPLRVALDRIESGVLYVTLHGCAATTQDIATLLPACPQLLGLTVQWAYDNQHHDWQILAWGLRHCPRLEQLIFVHGDAPWTYASVDQETLDAELDAFFGFGRLTDNESTIGGLRHLSRLAKLIITKSALYGRRSVTEDTQFINESEDEASNIAQAPAQLLSSLLPDSLEFLTNVVGSRLVLRSEAEKLLRDPVASRLKKMTVVGRTWKHWFSKTGGEGGISPSKGEWRRKRPAECM